MHHQEQVQAQSQAFDEMTDEKSETMRELNTLRDVQMAQRKADDAITKKFIESNRPVNVPAPLRSARAGEIGLQVRKARFDFVTEERAELQREYDAMRSLTLAQMKLDDEIAKKFIALV